MPPDILALAGSALLFLGAAVQAQDALTQELAESDRQGRDGMSTTCIALVAGLLLVLRGGLRARSAGLAHRLIGWTTIFFGALLAFLSTLAHGERGAPATGSTALVMGATLVYYAVRDRARLREIVTLAGRGGADRRPQQDGVDT